MSLQHNDAVLDRVLTRIVSAGNQRGQSGRSPARGIGSALQRDSATSRTISGVDKRKSGSTKLHATYRFGNATFGSTSRDSSLAGTNTMVPQIVFSKSILKVSGPLLLPLPAAAGPVTAQPANAATAPTAAASNPGAPTAAAAAAPAPTKTSSVILRQQQPRHSSPQPHLRASRCSSPPSQVAGASARSRSSPRDHEGSHGGGSPRILRAGATSGAGALSARSQGGGTGRSRSSPREQVTSGDGHLAVSPRVSPRAGGSARGFPPEGRVSSPDGGHAVRRATVHGEPPTASDAGVSAVAKVLEEGPGAGQRGGGGRGANTITRTAALRALKQQRATTPDLIAELREAAGARGSSAGGALGSDTVREASFSDAFFSDRSVANGGNRGVPVTASEGGAALPHPPLTLPVPALDTACYEQYPPQSGDKPQSQSHHHHHHQRASGQLRPLPEVCGSGGGADDRDMAQQALSQSLMSMSITARPAAVASASSACWGTVGGWGQETSVRSPSPRRGRAAGVEWSGAGAPALAPAGGVAQRQQRAMRQHLQRQASPSPGRRPGAGRSSSLERLPGVARAVLSPTQAQRSGSGEGSWQSDVVLAAQARIRRLEEQVVSLTAKVTELQTSHADLEFQLEEEQQQQNAHKGSGHGRSGGGGKAGGSPGRGGAAAPALAAAAAEAAQREQAQREKQQHQQLQKQVRELKDQLKQLQKQLKTREAEAGEQAAKARSVNDTLAKQNRALYSTLEETLSAAEHAAQELKQLRTAHAQLQASHDAAQRELVEARENLDLRDRALSAVQAEFSTLRRRHDEVLAASEAARRDSALRDGRLRKEVDTAMQEAASLASQLAKLQREHQQLHCRKAEKDRQLGALAKRADTQQEQLAAGERLAQEQAALVRELESRATLLRNRNAALDKAVNAEKEARQSAQEQVRQMEEEIALLVAIVRQSDPTLETLARYKADPAAAAAMAAAAAAAAAAALLQLSPSPTRGPRPDSGDGGQSGDVHAPVFSARGGGTPRAGSGEAAAAAAQEPALKSGRGGDGGRRRSDALGHSVTTITAGTVSSGDTGVAEAWPAQTRGTVMPAPPRTAMPPLPGFILPGSAPLVVRAPPPGTAPISRPAGNPYQHSSAGDGITEDELVLVVASTATEFRADTSTRSDALGQAAEITPRSYEQATAVGSGGNTSGHGALHCWYSNSRDGSPLGLVYPAKHCMTGGVFLVPSGRGSRPASSPRAGGSPHGVMSAAGRSRSVGGGATALSPRGSPRWPEELLLVSDAGSRRSKTPPAVLRAVPQARGRRGSDSGCKLVAPPRVRAAAAHAAAAASAGSPRRTASPPGSAKKGGVPTIAARTGSPKSSSRERPGSGRTSSPNRWLRAEGVRDRPGSMSPSRHPSAPLDAPTAIAMGEGDRVLWAQPRRGNRPTSTGSAGRGRQRSGGSGAREGGGAAAAVGGKTDGSYAALSARRALETSSALLAADGHRGNGSASCGGATREWVNGDRASRGGRRARTPEPRTVADWARLAAGPTAVAATDRATTRKRASTPDGRLGYSARGPHVPVRQPRGAPAHQTSAIEVSDLAAMLMDPSAGSHVWLAGVASKSATSRTRGAGSSSGGSGDEGAGHFRSSRDEARVEGSEGKGSLTVQDTSSQPGAFRSSYAFGSPQPPSRPSQQQPQNTRTGAAPESAAGPNSSDALWSAPLSSSPTPRSPQVVRAVDLASSGILEAEAALAAADAAGAKAAAAAAGGHRSSFSRVSSEDPLGAALRSLQQRQAQLLQQLTAGLTPRPGSTDAHARSAAELLEAGGAAAVAAAAAACAVPVPLSLLSPPAALSPPQHQQPPTPAAAQTTSSPSASAFSFHMSEDEALGQGQGCPGGAGAHATPELGRGDESHMDALADGCDEVGCGGAVAKAAARRRSGDTDEAASTDDADAEDHFSVVSDSRRQSAESTAAPEPQVTPQRTRHQQSGYQQHPQHSPLCTPRRQGITGAAAAAGGLGGVVGPLTALLDQLENAGDTWRTAPLEPGTPTSAPAPVAVATQPLQQQQQYHHFGPAMVTAVDEAILLLAVSQPQQQHLVTQLGLAALLGTGGTVDEVVKEKLRSPEKAELWQDQPVHLQQQPEPVSVESLEEEEEEGGYAVAYDEVVSEEEEEEGSVSEGDGDQGQELEAEVVWVDSRCTDGQHGDGVGVVGLMSSRADAEATEGAAEVVPRAPGGSHWGSQAGGPPAELSVDDAGVMLSSGGAPIRLGVSLYDNIAYDLSTRQSMTGEACDATITSLPAHGAACTAAAAAMAGRNPWSASSSLGPVRVPTSLGGSSTATDHSMEAPWPLSPSLQRPQRRTPAADAAGVSDFVTPRDSVSQILRDDSDGVLLDADAAVAECGSAPSDTFEGGGEAGDAVPAWEPSGASDLAECGDVDGAISEAEATTLVGAGRRVTEEEEAVMEPLKRQRMWSGSSAAELQGPDSERLGPCEGADEELDALVSRTASLSASERDLPLAPLSAQDVEAAEAEPAAADIGHTDTDADTAAASGGLAASSSVEAAVALPAAREAGSAATAAPVGRTSGSTSTDVSATRAAVSLPVPGPRRRGARTEPVLLDRVQQQPQPLLSLSRTSLGPIGGGAGGSSDWLQRRPQSPSVKPLSLAEVLRRPTGR